MAFKEIQVLTVNGEKIVLKPEVLIKGMNCILRLAPVELRSPIEFLYECYEQVKVLQSMEQLMETAINEEAPEQNQIQIPPRKVGEKLPEEQYDCDDLCHVRFGCPDSVSPGDDYCLKRRGADGVLEEEESPE